MQEFLGQGITTSTVVAGLFALVLLYLIFRALAGPAKYLWRVFVVSVLGLLLIVGTNAIGQLAQFSVPLNPFTVLLAGYLGIPGAVALILIQVLLR